MPCFLYNQSQGNTSNNTPSMIRTYHRPSTLDEALRLLARPAPYTVPLGGGTLLSHHRGEDIDVVDLQALGLNEISMKGQVVEAGCSCTLQKILEWPECPRAMASATKLEAPLNLRNAASVAGTLLAADGRSPFTSVLLALDAHVRLKLSESEDLQLGEFLPQRSRMKRGFLVTSVTWSRAPDLEFDYVARTPADSPIVAVAVARWPSGRTRVVAGGWGPAPLLAMDGTDSGGVESAVRNALHDATDAWGSSTYRMDAGAILASRCLARLGAASSTSSPGAA